MKKSVLFLAIGLTVPPFLAVASLGAQIKSVLHENTQQKTEPLNTAPLNTAPLNTALTHVKIGQGLEIKMEAVDAKIEFDEKLEGEFLYESSPDNAEIILGAKVESEKVKSVHIAGKDKNHNNIRLVLPLQLTALHLNLTSGKLDLESTAPLKITNFTLDIAAGKADMRTNELQTENLNVHMAAGKLDWNCAELNLAKAAQIQVQSGKIDLNVAKITWPQPQHAPELVFSVQAGKGNIVLGGLSNYSLDATSAMGSLSVERTGEPEVSLNGMGGQRHFQQGTGGPQMKADLQMGSLDLKLERLGVRHVDIEIVADIDENRCRAGNNDRVRRCDPRHRGNDHLIAGTDVESA